MGLFDSDIDPFTGKKIKSSAQKTRESLTQSMILKIKDAVNYRCEIPKCNHKGHEVHHIRPIAKGGTNVGSNLIVLCANHHTEVHSGAFTQTQLKEIIKNRTTETSNKINAILRSRAKVGTEKKSSSKPTNPIGLGSIMSSGKKPSSETDNLFGLGSIKVGRKKKKDDDSFRLFK